MRKLRNAKLGKVKFGLVNALFRPDQEAGAR